MRDDLIAMAYTISIYINMTIAAIGAYVASSPVYSGPYQSFVFVLMSFSIAHLLVNFGHKRNKDIAENELFLITSLITYGMYIIVFYFMNYNIILLLVIVTMAVDMTSLYFYRRHTS